MKLKYIIFQLILLIVFFFWDIGSTFSGKGTVIPGHGDETASISLNLNNELSAFDEAYKVDQEIEKFRKRLGIKGISVAITKDGRLVYAKGFGFANEEKGEKTDPKHIFRLASVSKLITAITIMHLCEEGKLGLDDKVFGKDGILNDPCYSNYVDMRMENITIRHLLTHRAGWSRRSGDPMFMPHIIARKMNVDLPVNNETIIEYALTRKLNYAPGAKYSYSNLGYSILGEIIDKVTGIKYEDYVKLAILTPLGIYDMHLGDSYYDQKAINEVAYYETYPARKVLAFDRHKEFVNLPYGGSDIRTLGAAGGWIASPAELLKLVVAVDGVDSKPDILKKESIAAMTNRGTSGRDMMGWKGSDGYGTWWRTGTLIGNSALLVRQNNGITWVIVMNTSTAKRSRIHSETSRMMFNVVASIKQWPEYDLFEFQQPAKINPNFLTRLDY